MKSTNPNRREFMKTTTIAAAGATVASALLPPSVHAVGDDVIRVGCIGCGGRGTGAIDNVLHAARNVQIVALADAFQDRADACKRHVGELAQDEAVKKLGNKADLGDRVFVGLDAYEKLLKCDLNYVILATPPGFRPIHLQAAVAAGKNIFTEKPVAVDGPGIRKVFDAYEESKKKNLAIVAGTQRRHQLGYLEIMKQLHDGAIGDIVAGRCYWNQGLLWNHPRQAGQSDLVYQLKNWYYYVWLCGDQIVEQHVHNLDVINWAMGKTPVAAVGMGGRQRSVPNPKDWGHIFDHFAVDYEFPNGVHVMSMCRQIDGTEYNISEALVGTKGFCQANEYKINGKRILSRAQDQASVDPYIQEHTDLIAHIRGNKPINELKTVAESTLTAIMGRMSTYTGKKVTWDMALNSREDTMPANLDWNMSLPEPPIPIPGQTKFI